MKTTEAAFVHLNRFLLLPKATSILKRSCGVRGAVGLYSLLSVSMCILMISAKYEEIYPPSQSVFAEYAHCNVSEFEMLELNILHIMKWSLVTSTPVDFLGRFFESVETTSKTNLLAMFILEASSRVEMAVETDASIFKLGVKSRLKNSTVDLMPASVLMVAKPSVIALGCIILSLAYQGKFCNPVTMEYSSRIRPVLISNVVEELHQQLRIETNTRVTQHSAIVRKYSQRKFQNVGAFKPPPFRELLEHNAFGGTELAGIYNNNKSLKLGV